MTTPLVGIETGTTKTVSLKDKELSIVTGVLATQAGGAAVVRLGDTVVLGTANMGGPLYEEGDFLPLLVDYEERFYAAGKIKGSRFIKREGRPSDDATLVARLTDRAIRPLFPDGMINDVQVVITVLSYDGKNDPDVLALIAASAALSVSDVPWHGPLAGVRVSRLNDQFVINPTTEERERSTLDLVVAGTGDRVIMIEAAAHEVPETVLLDALDEARTYLGKIVPAISALAQEAGRPKREPALVKVDAGLLKRLKSLARPPLLEKLEAAKRKADFRAATVAGTEVVRAQLTEEEQAAVTDAVLRHAIHEARGDISRERALHEGRREGGRALDEIRPLTIRVGVLPRTHGSSLFQRGETQILNVVTLGGPSDVQFIDTMEIEAKKHYIHHYNFPGFSVGENKPMRFPSRREIGHGALAERAILPVLPPRDTWPYTMLLVSEVLESNGSSSMASVCGSSLSLMDAGVPITRAVAGIAMGLYTDGRGKFAVLTDIAGVEDEEGDMDFKVAGSDVGITALQMDTKVEGLTRAVLEQTLTQARHARLKILDAMNAVIAAPRAELSPYAPRIEIMRVAVEKIGDLIGPRGKHINAIIEETGVDIDISDDGLVSITSNDAAAMAKAKEWVKNMTREVVVGERFEGRVTRIMEFGAFVELIPGTGVEGMVHISQFRDHRIDSIRDVVKIGDVIPVIVTEVDEMGRINLSHKAALPGGTATPAGEGDRPYRSRGGRHETRRVPRARPGAFRGPRPPRGR